MDSATGVAAANAQDSWEAAKVSARTPEEVHLEFERALEARDLERLTAIYEPDAVLVVEPGTTISGHAAIRTHLEEMIRGNPRLESETTVVVPAGDVAMLRARWSIRATGPDGELAETGESTEIVRRQADGTWKCVIDNPRSC